MAVSMKLSLPDAEPVAECQCGFRCYGDSINDAVLAWTRHVTTSACREEL